MKTSKDKKDGSVKKKNKNYADNVDYKGGLRITLLSATSTFIIKFLYIFLIINKYLFVLG